jgi:hypothetical protein
MMFPFAPEGYAVDLATVVAHRRYATCLPDLRRVRNWEGVLEVTGWRMPDFCPACFPETVPIAPEPKRSRRSPVKAEAVIQVPVDDGEDGLVTDPTDAEPSAEGDA